LSDRRKPRNLDDVHVVPQGILQIKDETAQVEQRTFCIQVDQEVDIARRACFVTRDGAEDADVMRAVRRFRPFADSIPTSLLLAAMRHERCARYGRISPAARARGRWMLPVMLSRAARRALYLT
jgi:hypothetical protein